MAMDATGDPKSELWKIASDVSRQDQYGTKAASFLFGLNFKRQTEEDRRADKIWGDVSKLMALRDVMTADDYNASWRELQGKYNGDMDLLMVGRHTGKEWDAAYAYSVLSRIPPGESSEILESAGIMPDMQQGFYDNKGDISSLSKADQKRWIAGIESIGLMVKIPSDATREEWNLAKSTYTDMGGIIEQRYGAGINDSMWEYAALKTEEERQTFLEARPGLEEAMTFKAQFIMETPILNAYYGGLDHIERYEYSRAYAQLEAEFGKDIRKREQEYYDLLNNLETAEAKKVKAELKPYFERKTELIEEALLRIVESGKDIPEGKGYQIRPEFQAQTEYQQQELEATFAEETPTWEQLRQIIPPNLEAEVRKYFDSGEELSYQERNALDAIAQRNGYYGWKDLLTAAGVAE
jgi:hypothetical protein